MMIACRLLRRWGAARCSRGLATTARRGSGVMGARVDLLSSFRLDLLDIHSLNEDELSEGHVLSHTLVSDPVRRTQFFAGVEDGALCLVPREVAHVLLGCGPVQEAPAAVPVPAAVEADNGVARADAGMLQLASALRDVQGASLQDVRDMVPQLRTVASNEGSRRKVAAEAEESPALEEELDALFGALELGPADGALRMLAQGFGPLTAHHPRHGGTPLHVAAGTVDGCRVSRAAVTAVMRQRQLGAAGEGLGFVWRRDADGGEVLVPSEGQEEGGGKAAVVWGGDGTGEGRPTTVMGALLALGADPNARAQNWSTPLHWAAGAGNLQQVRELLDAGADPTLRTCTWRSTVFGKGSGETALHWAAASGQDEAVALLVAACPLASVCEDERGNQPAEAAAKEGHASLSLALRRAGSMDFVALRVRHEGWSHRVGGASPALQ